MSYSRLSTAIAKTHPNLVPQSGEIMDVAMGLIATVVEDLQRQVQELSKAKPPVPAHETLFSIDPQTYEKWSSSMQPGGIKVWDFSKTYQENEDSNTPIAEAPKSCSCPPINFSFSGEGCKCGGE